MKIIVFCDDGENQKALLNKINKKIKISSIVVQTKTVNIDKRNKLRQAFDKSLQTLRTIMTLSIYRRVWFGMLAYYEEKYPSFPIKPILRVGNINDQVVLNFVEKEKPNLVIVSGTNILKNHLIEVIKKNSGRIVNLHTGISPYVKGSPNCTNWCLYLKEFGMIGNTVMWLDAGIDSGNIICTEQTPLTRHEDFFELHLKVMEHAHDLLLRVILTLKESKKLNNVPQNSFQPSRLFLNKDWRLKQMIFGLINFYIFYKPDSKYFTNPKVPNLVKLED